jgi:hypothetical protein
MGEILFALWLMNTLKCMVNDPIIERLINGPNIYGTPQGFLWAVPY